MSIFTKSAWRTVCNSNDAFVPEFWARESLRILESSLVMANLVNKDYSSDVASYGDVVNTRMPTTFVATNKVDGDEVYQQSAETTNVQVCLNQHAYQSFIIYDREMSLSFTDLVNFYLRPAVRAIAVSVDETVMAQKYAFLANSVGKLGVAPTKSTLVDAQIKLDSLNCPLENRYGIITAAQKGAILNVDAFTEADKVGDRGEAVRNGSIGQKLGTQWVMTQNNRTIGATTTKTGAVNKTAGYAAGSTSIAMDGFGTAPVAGEWLTIAGDMTPQFVTAYGSNTATITPGLKYAVANDAVVTAYTAGAINLSAGYTSGYNKALAIDGFSIAPQTGQLISIGTSGTGARYGAKTLGIGSSGSQLTATTNLMIDRPLEANAANDAVVGVGPAGDYGFVFHPDAITLVSRPLALPPVNNVRSAVVNYNGLAIRVCVGYNMAKQGTQVNVDVLYGVKVLNTSLGCVMYS